MSRIEPQAGQRPPVSAAAATRVPVRPVAGSQTAVATPFRQDALQQRDARGLAPVLFPLTVPADATAVRHPAILPQTPVTPLPDHVRIRTVPMRNQLSESTNNNACGTNALWMAMAYHNGADRVDFRDLDRSCRATGVDLGSSPDLLAAYARKHGMAATIHHGSTTNDLRRMIAAGLPPIILTDWHADTTPGKSLHYLVVTGYSSQDDARTLWTVNNPWGGKVETVDTATLMTRWSNLYLKPVHTPINRLMLTVAPPDKRGVLPKSNPNLGQALTLGAVDVITAGGQIVDGVVQAVKRVGRMAPPIGVMPLLPLSPFWPMARRPSRPSGST